MSKYTTIPLGYKGCNEVIKEHLQQGLCILCRVGDFGSSPVELMVIGFKEGRKAPYECDDGSHYMNAEPLRPLQPQVKKASEIVKWLEDNGYFWCPDGWLHPQGKHHAFTHQMFKYCGQDKPDVYKWQEEWLTGK